MDITATDALVVVDAQIDFAPGGALAVRDGNLVVPVINDLQPYFETIAFTRDWHPADHCSFAEDPQYVDGSWPRHCVADTPGADFIPGLHVPVDAIRVNKAEVADKETYSGFEDTDLAARLRDRGVKRLIVCGLATDYCVKATALDGKREGFDVTVVLDACRAVDSPPGSERSALDELRDAGVTLCRSAEVLP